MELFTLGALSVIVNFVARKTLIESGCFFQYSILASEYSNEKQKVKEAETLHRADFENKRVSG